PMNSTGLPSPLRHCAIITPQRLARRAELGSLGAERVDDSNGERVLVLDRFVEVFHKEWRVRKIAAVLDPHHDSILVLELSRERELLDLSSRTGKPLRLKRAPGGHEPALGVVEIFRARDEREPIVRLVFQVACHPLPLYRGARLLLLPVVVVASEAYLFGCRVGH